MGQVFSTGGTPAIDEVKSTETKPTETKPTETKAVKLADCEKLFTAVLDATANKSAANKSTEIEPKSMEAHYYEEQFRCHETHASLAVDASVRHATHVMDSLLTTRIGGKWKLIVDAARYRLESPCKCEHMYDEAVMSGAKMITWKYYGEYYTGKKGLLTWLLPDTYKEDMTVVIAKELYTKTSVIVHIGVPSTRALDSFVAHVECERTEWIQQYQETMAEVAARRSELTKPVQTETTNPLQIESTKPAQADATVTNYSIGC